MYPDPLLLLALKLKGGDDTSLSLISHQHHRHSRCIAFYKFLPFTFILDLLSLKALIDMQNFSQSR